MRIYWECCAIIAGTGGLGRGIALWPLCVVLFSGRLGIDNAGGEGEIHLISGWKVYWKGRERSGKSHKSLKEGQEKGLKERDR